RVAPKTLSSSVPLSHTARGNYLIDLPSRNESRKPYVREWVVTKSATFMELQKKQWLLALGQTTRVRRCVQWRSPSLEPISMFLLDMLLHHTAREHICVWC